MRKAEEDEIRRREIQLFLNTDKGWPDVQKRAGVTFGTASVRVKLYDVFEKMVMKR